MTYTIEELCLIWLDSFSGLEYKHKNTLIALTEKDLNAKSLVEKGKDYILTALNTSVYSTLKSALTNDYMNYVLQDLEKQDIKCVTIKSKDYPQTLKNIKCPPLVLYAKGDLSLLKEKLFCIVGSRKSLPLSLALAKDYVNALVDADFTLVTGIAQGVDETVIKSVLEKGRKAISVITGGFNNVYPKSNVSLLEKVASQGLVLSEYPPAVAPMPFMFPIRNRIFAGLSSGVLIVSAGKKSGTLWTADYAVEYGKDVFAIPYSVGIASGEGCNNLIKQGAILTDSPSDILNYYGIEEKQNQVEQFSLEEKELIKLLSNGEMHVEKLSAKLNKRTFEIMPLLSILEIKGVVIKEGNIYQLARNYSEE